MPEPILATKLYLPTPRSNRVLRPRLLRRLNDHLHCKLILISAPAGFGKTTLVSEWIADLGQDKTEVQAAWLSLDERDSDLTRFLIYFIAALQTVAAQFGRGVLAVLQSPQPPPTEALLTTLLNEAAALPDQIIIVLDDYHTLDSRAVDQAIAFLLEHLPPQMHLVIAAREDPVLPLARLRARGQLAELRAADLRFTPAEAAEFLNHSMGLQAQGMYLSPEDITALERRTEGWIAGLQMAGLALQGLAAQNFALREAATMPPSSQMAGFIQSFTGSHHFVLDYLLEEVLHKQPERIQAFLLRTSILDRLCGPLCEAVCFAGTDPLDLATSGQETLEYLEHANLFIVPLDRERRWYRYHRLFADLLRQRLRHMGISVEDAGAEQVAEYHRRASQWYETNDLADEAFQHAVAARDFERAARLAELAWPEMFQSSLQNTLFLDWMKALPDALIRRRPVLSAGYGWALLDIGELEAADARLQDAERCLDTGPAAQEGGETPDVADMQVFRWLPATLALARAYLALAYGDVTSAIERAGWVLAQASETDTFQRAGAAALLGAAYLSSGDLEAASRAISEGLVGVNLIGNISLAISGIVPLAGIRIAQGRLSEAVRIYERARQRVAEQGDAAPPGMADLYLGLSDLCLEHGDLETAGQHLLRSQALGELAGLPDFPYRLRLSQSRNREVHGDLDEALDLLDQAERLYFRGPLPNVWPIAAIKARLWVKQGRLAKVLGWVRDNNLSVDDEISYLSEFELITLARLLIAGHQRGRPDCSIVDALQLLGRLQEAAAEGGRSGSLIEILVIQSLAHQARGSLPQALAALEQALVLAEPESYVQVFAAEGQPVKDLLARLKAENRGPAGYIQKLLSAFTSDQPGEPSVAASPTTRLVRHDDAHALIEPLSERELEVLKLLATDLSGPEIARYLVVSLNTLRTHTKNIYTKLGVNTRRAAIQRAGELHLLP